MLQTKNIDPEIYYSVTEVIQFLGVHRQTIYNWVWQGKILNVKKLGARRTYILGQDILDIIKER